MVITKDRLQYIVDGLPQSIDIQIVVDELILLDKTEKARQQIKEGKYLTEDEMDKEIDSWQ